MDGHIDVTIYIETRVGAMVPVVLTSYTVTQTYTSLHMISPPPHKVSDHHIVAYDIVTDV